LITYPVSRNRWQPLQY